VCKCDKANIGAGFVHVPLCDRKCAKCVQRKMTQRLHRKVLTTEALRHKEDRELFTRMNTEKHGWF
jgi:hypothetical protein